MITRRKLIETTSKEILGADRWRIFDFIADMNDAFLVIENMENRGYRFVVNTVTETSRSYKEGTAKVGHYHCNFVMDKENGEQEWNHATHEHVGGAICISALKAIGFIEK